MRKKVFCIYLSQRCKAARCWAITFSSRSQEVACPELMSATAFCTVPSLHQCSAATEERMEQKSRTHHVCSTQKSGGRNSTTKKTQRTTRQKKTRQKKNKTKENKTTEQKDHNLNLTDSSSNQERRIAQGNPTARQRARHDQPKLDWKWVGTRERLQEIIMAEKKTTEIQQVGTS